MTEHLRTAVAKKQVALKEHTPSQSFGFHVEGMADKKLTEERWTFATPFMVLSLLMLPTLLVLTVTHNGVGAQAFKALGYHEQLRAVFMLALPLVLLFGLLFLWRTRNWIGRVAAVLMLLALPSMFLYAF